MREPLTEEEVIRDLLATRLISLGVMLQLIYEKQPASKKSKRLKDAYQIIDDLGLDMHQDLLQFKMSKRLRAQMLEYTGKLASGFTSLYTQIHIIDTGKPPGEKDIWIGKK